MKVPCSYPSCGERRIHHERQYTPRGTRYIDVPDSHIGPYYCSITCAVMDGAMSLTLTEEESAEIHEKIKRSRFHKVDGCPRCAAAPPGE